MTASTTSSPRCAGRQWRKIASSAARAIAASSTRNGTKQPRRYSSSSIPIEHHVSVTTTLAPSSASRGSSVKKIPCCVLAIAAIVASASKPLGVATTNSKSISAAASISELQTLLPSPSHAQRDPFNDPRRSITVIMSASNWHGCDRSVSPLITGTAAMSASSSALACAPVRITTASA